MLDRTLVDTRGLWPRAAILLARQSPGVEECHPYELPQTREELSGWRDTIGELLEKTERAWRQRPARVVALAYGGGLNGRCYEGGSSGRRRRSTRALAFDCVSMN